MDWFRWHHGTTTDRKWPRIAARADTTVAAVIAVWASLLEIASHAEDRGHVHLTDDDEEDLDAALGLALGTTRRIVAELCAREMLTLDNRIAAWDRRQPKRERDEPTGSSTERVREHRARKRVEAQAVETADVTPCNATQHQKQPRGEERREELPTGNSSHTPCETAAPLAVVGGFEGQAQPQAGSNPAAPHAIALTKAGFACTAMNPELVAFARDGGTVEHLLQTASLPECRGKKAGYVLSIARRELATLAAAVDVHAQPRAGPRYAPSKSAMAIQSLEALKSGNRLAAGRNPDRAAEALHALPGPNAGR